MNRTFILIRPMRNLLALPALLVALILLVSTTTHAQERTMMQGFYWDATPGAVWYDTLAHYSDVLAQVGFNSIWFPPPSKGAAGPFDVGYTPYDYYDLGEFDSAPGDRTSGLGNYIPTRYGTRAGLEAAIARFQQNGMKVYADIVVNHRSGGNLEPNPYAQWYTDRNGGSLFSPDGDSTFTAFPLTHGSGRIAWPVGEGGQFFFPNSVRNPSNTPDFFSGSQIGGFHQLYVNSFGYDNALHNGDGTNLPLGDSLMVWGEWLVNEIGFDGFRFDFVKGVHPDYFKRFMSQPATSGLFHVHELYDGDINRLRTYLNQISGTPTQGAIFDFNLRFAYKEMSDGGDNFDIRALHSRGLMHNGVPYDQIVTFVENHDFDRTNYRGEVTQEGHSPIIGNKILAYAHMLTHPGYAQVFWRDYFHYGMRDQINRLVQIRSQFSSGDLRILTAYVDESGDFQRPFWPGNAVEDPRHVYVAERTGTGGQTGLVVAINKHSSFNIDVWVTVKPWAGRMLYDITGNIPGEFEVFADGRVRIPTRASSYAVLVPTDYVLDETINIEMSAVESPGTGYLVGDEVQPRVRIANRSDFSQTNVPVVFELSFDGDAVRQDTVTVPRIEAGSTLPVSFPAFTFDAIGEYEAVARVAYQLDQFPGDDAISFTINVADTLGAWPFRIDGIASESQYRTMAAKQNANSGFGLGKDVRALRFADTADTLYIFIEGRVPLTDGDGIGLFLDFSELDGVEAGQALGGVPGAQFFLNSGTPARDNFAMDFEVDYGFALFGVQGGRAVLSVADYTRPDPVGVLIAAPGDAPTPNGTAADGPASGEVFPEGSFRYAVSTQELGRHGIEIAIAREALGWMPGATASGEFAGLTGGEVRGFAFIVSSTAYFSNVLVPGDAVGDADAFGNFGFSVDFSALTEGGPFHSAWMPVNSSDAQPAPGLTELAAPEDGAVEVALRPQLSWHPTERASWYSVQIGRPVQDVAISKEAGSGSGASVSTGTSVSTHSSGSASSSATTSASATTVTGGRWRPNHLAETHEFGEEVLFVEVVNDTLYVPAAALDPETDYIWRVRAVNSSGEGPWSATRMFTTGSTVAAPTQAPVLLEPANDDNFAIPGGILVWEEVEGAVDYHLQVSNTQFFFAFAAVVFTEDTIVQNLDLAVDRRFFWRVRARNEGGVGPWSEVRSFQTRRFVSIEDEDIGLPVELALHQNHPNPFNPTTTIGYDVPIGGDAAQQVSLVVYDLLGREVAVLVNGVVSPGRYTVTFDATRLSTGVYIYRLQSGNRVITRKMTIVK